MCAGDSHAIPGNVLRNTLAVHICRSTGYAVPDKNSGVCACGHTGVAQRACPSSVCVPVGMHDHDWYVTGLSVRICGSINPGRTAPMQDVHTRDIQTCCTDCCADEPARNSRWIGAATGNEQIPQCGVRCIRCIHSTSITEMLDIRIVAC